MFIATAAAALLQPIPEMLVDEGASAMRVAPGALTLAPGAPVQLELPDGRIFELVVLSTDRTATGRSILHARPSDSRYAGYLFTLTGSSELGLFGTVLAPGGEYRIEPAGTAWNEVRLVMLEPPAGPQCGVRAGWPSARPSSGGSFESVPLDAESDETVTVLNLLVLYSASARGNLSEAQWHARLDDLLAVTNAAYADSGTQVQFQWVDTRPVAAGETASSAELLSQLMPTGGAFDALRYGQVERWRLEADAHLVTLLREYQPSHANCGYAGQLVCGDDVQCYSAALGYSVVSLGACSALVLAHELGHNLGSAHAPGEAGLGGTFPYAFGHVTPAGAGTIMALSGTRQIARFSAPELDCDGHPCGIPELRDNARSMRQTRHYIARWLTDRSISLFEQPPLQVKLGRGLPLNFGWFGVLTPRFDIELRRYDETVALLVAGEELPGGFRLLAIPEGPEPGTGYTLRVRATDRPEVFVDSAAFELVPATEPPSSLAFTAAAVSVPAGGTMAEITVRREGGTEGMVLVEYATQDGSAIGGVHYTPAPAGSALAWPDGNAEEYRLSIPVVPAAGSNRSFIVMLRNPSAGAALGSPSTAMVTIIASPGGGGNPDSGGRGGVNRRGILTPFGG